MRCSYCLSIATVKDGMTVCTYCGKQSEIRMADGQLAVFETTYFGLSPAAIKGGFLAVFVGVLMAGLASLYIWVMQPGEPVARPELIASDTRLVLRSTLPSQYGSDVKDKILQVLGTGRNDRALGFARLPSGDAMVLIRTGDLDVRTQLVHVTGDGAVSILPDQAVGARPKKLIGGPNGQVYLLAEIPSGTNLSSISERGISRWNMQIAGAAPAELSLATSESGLLISRSIASGDIFSVTRVSADGVQLWQRSFTENVGSKISVTLHASGEAVVLFQESYVKAGLSSRLVRLDPFGQIVLDTELAASIPFGEEIKISSAGHIYIFSLGPVPSVTKVTGEGTISWTTEISEAILLDTVDIITGVQEGPTIVWAYQLADIQTDLGVIQISESGEKSPAQVFSFPSGGAVQSVYHDDSDNLHMLAEFDGGADHKTDVALLKFRHLSFQPPVSFEEASEGKRADEEFAENPATQRELLPEAQSEPSRELQEAAQIQEPADPMEGAGSQQIVTLNPNTPISEPSPETGTKDARSDDTESAVSKRTIQCRFVCVVDGEPLGSWQAVDPEGDNFSIGSPEVHKNICQKLGGRMSEEAQRCRSTEK